MFKLLKNKFLATNGRQKAVLVAAAVAVVIGLIGGIFYFANSADDAPDVDHITVPLTVHHFEADLFAIDTQSPSAAAQGLAALEQKYPVFTPNFFENIIGVKDPLDSVGQYRTEAYRFLTDPMVRYAYDSVRRVYADFSTIEKDLKKGFQYYKYYFPQKQIPEVYTYVGGYTLNGGTYESHEKMVFIGLDLFLGESYTPYTQLLGQYPKFVQHTFRPDYVVKRTFEAIVADMAGMPSGNRLLDYMIHNGKKLYVLDKLLPFVADSLKMNYKAGQLEGCVANESLTWARILQQNLLYSTENRRFMKLVSPSPDASIIATEAPGEVGNFIGWRIVEAYMQRHPETSLEALLGLRDAQKILDGSKYKPDKR